MTFVPNNTELQANLLDSETLLKEKLALILGEEAARKTFDDFGVLPTDAVERRKVLVHLGNMLSLMNEPDDIKDLPGRTANERGVSQTEDISISLVQTIGDIKLFVDETEGLDGESRQYIDYVFGDAGRLSLTRSDVPAIVDALVELNDGFGKITDPKTLITALHLKLYGVHPKEIAAAVGAPQSEITSKIKAYRTRSVRIAKQRDIGPQKKMELLETHVRSQRAERSESSIQPNLNGPISERMQKFLNEVLTGEEGVGTEYMKTDAVAIVEAISRMVNENSDNRHDVDKFKTILYRTLLGFSNPEIASIEGISLEAIESSLKRIKLRIREKVKSGGTSLKFAIDDNVQLFRLDSQLHQNIRSMNGDIYKLPMDIKDRWAKDPDLSRKRQQRREKQLHEGRPVPKQIRHPRRQSSKPEVVNAISPKAMPRRIEKSDAPLFEIYKNYSSVDRCPDDDDCPEFPTLWGMRSMELLQETLIDDHSTASPATIIMRRADGRDKTRRHDPDVVKAFRLLRGMANRSKYDFDDDNQMKRAFEMLTIPADAKFNTLGDICRKFKAENPTLDDREIAEIVIGSVSGVVKDYQKVLVIEH